MSNLTVVGHFSTVLVLAWVVWIAWLAGQILWYRRLTAAPAEIASYEPPPEPKPERSVPLRAPGAALRSMTSASTTRPAPQPSAETPPDEPAAPAPPAVEPSKEPGSEIKPFE